MDAVDIPFEGADTTQRFLIGHASCAVPGTVAGLAAAHRVVRHAAVAGARRACDRARARRRRDDEGAGAAARAARLDPPAHARGQGRVRRGEARLVAGDRLVAPDLADDARGARGGGAGRDLSRRARRGDRGARAGARRSDHASRSRGVPRDSPPAGGGRVSRPRVRVEPAAVLGRRADRLRACAARPCRRGERCRFGPRARARDRGAARADGSERRALHARALPRRAREAAAVGGRSRGSERDDAHLGHGRRRQCRVTVVVDRRRLRRRRPRHRHPHEQHARRVRPPAGRPRAEAGHAADEHDGAVRRVESRRAAPRPGQRGLGATPRGRHAGGHQRRRPRPERGGGDRRPSRARRRSRTSTARAGTTHRHSTSSREAGYDVVRWRRRNLFFGGVAAVERRPDGTLAAAGDPRRGGHGIVV